MSTNQDQKRVFDGFRSFEGGVDSNSDPALLPVNECAFLGNMSLRANIPSTRPPYVNRMLNFDNLTTLTNFAGMYQGCCFYESLEDETQNSLIVSISGHLFRVFLRQNFLVKEITPAVPNTVTADFTVPAVSGSVTIDVGDSSVFTVNQILVIDGGTYTVTNVGADQITVTYGGGALNTGWVVPAQTAVLDNADAAINVTLNEKVTVTVTVPLVNQQLVLTVTSGTGFSGGQLLLIDSGSYTILSIGGNLLTVNYNGGAANTTIPLNTPILAKQVASETVGVGGFTVPAINASVTVPISGASSDFTNPQPILIDGGAYTVTALGAGSITCTYRGGALNATVTAGKVIYGAQSTVTIPEVTTNTFTIPALNSNVTIPVTSETAFSPAQLIKIGGETFTVVSALAGLNQIVATWTGGVYHAISGSQILDVLGNQIVSYATNPADADFVFLWQGENYVFIVCENQDTLYFDGSTVRPMNQASQQLQSSYLGCYAWGRNWMPQVNGHRFVASDLVGDPSGSPALNYVDAILYMTENNILNGGGAFSTPANLGIITAMSVLAQLDTSLGIGPVLVGTIGSIFSVQAPVDRTTWQNLTYPIQSVALQGAGPTGPRAMITLNSDAWFRSLDGARSLVASRRDFQSNRSNTPNSIEMSTVFDNDSKGLLFYASIADFDNRTIFTASPYRTKYGVAHRGLAIINRDSISSINKDELPIWEGLWTGLNVFQLVTGILDGEPHGYAFVLNKNNGIDLWEFLPETEDGTYDVAQSLSVGPEMIPPNTKYSSSDYQVQSLLTPGKSYSIVWGADESYFAYGIYPTVTTIQNPGVGQITAFDYPIGANYANFNTMIPFSVVTAQVYGQNVFTLTNTAIQCWLETRAMPFGDPEQLKKLIMGELYLDQITDNVQVKIFFRPDQYPLWTLWTTINICANVTQCTLSADEIANCAVWQEQRKQYGARLTIARPPETPNNITNKPMNLGFEFQSRMEITGSCRVRKFKLHAVEVQQEMEGTCPPQVDCKTLTGCLPGFYTYNSYGP